MRQQAKRTSSGTYINVSNYVTSTPNASPLHVTNTVSHKTISSVQCTRTNSPRRMSTLNTPVTDSINESVVSTPSPLKNIDVPPGKPYFTFNKSPNKVMYNLDNRLQNCNGKQLEGFRKKNLNKLRITLIKKFSFSKIIANVAPDIM